MTEPRDRWLLYRHQVADARLRLVCFPYGGGGASAYSAWQQAMPAGVELWPVQTPGRENRFDEPPIARLPEMIDRLAEVLAPHLDCPYALFGHSVGALEAFELARRLRRDARRPPEWLFVSALPCPGLPARLPPVHHLPFADFVAAMRGPYEMDPEILARPAMMELIYPALRADYELVETHAPAPEPPLDVPLSAFGGRGDPETTEAEIEAWGRHTTGPFRHRMLDGKHMFITTAGDLLRREVARDLRLALALCRR